MMPSVVVWACLATTVVTAVLGASRHHHSGQLTTRSGLDDLLDRLDSSIQKKNKRLQRGLPTTFQYRTDRGAEEEEDENTPIMSQHGSFEEQSTHTEDINDFVNTAPWTRRQHEPRPKLAKGDLHIFKLASQYARWVTTNGKCQTPLRRCVEVTSQDQQSATLRYWPRCALLHRCGEDAGCCNSADMTCATADSEKVNLYFYVFDSGRAGVQVLTFNNDTRCACQPRSVLSTPNTITQECKCPRHFSLYLRDGQCSCDCDDGNNKCRRLKKGRRYFTNADVSCVTSGVCTEPTCEYGPFLLQQKRCSKRREREHNSTHRK
ncbi:uncharacterized protein [Cherax quadricarinatus]